MLSIVKSDSRIAIRTDQANGGADEEEFSQSAKSSMETSIGCVQKAASAKKLESFHTTNRWCGIGWLQKSYRKYIPETEGPASSEEIIITTHFIPAAWLTLPGISLLQASHVYGRWTYSYTPIYVVPNNSPVFAACEVGDLEEIERLFGTGDATIYDTNENGWTLLHVSARKDLLVIGAPELS